jgi:hypothetical protein
LPGLQSIRHRLLDHQTRRSDTHPLLELTARLEYLAETYRFIG